MVVLSERLKAIIEMVAPSGVAADIGCDHCLTLIELVSSGACKKAIGSDIKPGPIGKAYENLKKFGLEDKVELRLGAGLEKINPGEADTLIISGMGGFVINDILEEGLETAKVASQLVLQPQNRIREVREKLHELGFKITDEKIVSELSKYYTIIRAVSGRQSYIREIDYIFGKELIEGGSSVLREFLEKRLNKNDKLIHALIKQNTQNSVLKTKELEMDSELTKEALSCLLK